MKNILATLLLLTLLTTPLQARRHKEILEEQTIPKESLEFVVEANHFSSTTQTKTSFDINLEKDKPILFLLKPHNAEATD